MWMLWLVIEKWLLEHKVMLSRANGANWKVACPIYLVLEQCIELVLLIPILHFWWCQWN